jgi:hypothetical protein
MKIVKEIIMAAPKEKDINGDDLGEMSLPRSKAKFNFDTP